MPFPPTVQSRRPVLHPCAGDGAPVRRPHVVDVVRSTAAHGGTRPRGATGGAGRSALSPPVKCATAPQVRSGKGVAVAVVVVRRRVTACAAHIVRQGPGHPSTSGGRARARIPWHPHRRRRTSASCSRSLGRVRTETRRRRLCTALTPPSCCSGRRRPHVRVGHVRAGPSRPGSPGRRDHPPRGRHRLHSVLRGDVGADGRRPGREDGAAAVRRARSRHHGQHL